MQRWAAIIGAVGVLVLVGAVIFRFTAAAPLPAESGPDASFAEDPVASPEAGVDAGPAPAPSAGEVVTSTDAGLDAGELALDPEPETAEEGATVRARTREVVTSVGASLPLCGRDGPIVVRNGPEGEPSQELASCEQLGQDIGTSPAFHTVSGETEDWLEFSDLGWIHKDDVWAAEVVVAGKHVIPLPCFQCRIVAAEPGSLKIEGDLDPCLRETCAYHEEPSPEGAAEPAPEVEAPEPGLKATIDLPEELNLSTPQVVRSFTPMCCT